MRLFNKTIDRQLFKQYPLGSDLSKQEVVVKIFNPQGAGSWYILNSDPEDPDYLWAIVDLGYGAEVGSVSRSDLETYRGKFGLGFERDLSFDPVNAEELYKGLRQGKYYAKGGNLRQSLEEVLKQNVTFLKFDSSRAYDKFSRLDIPFINVHDYDFNHYCIIETKNLEKVLDNVSKGVRVVKKKFSSDDLGFDYKGSTSFADGGDIENFSDNQRMIMNQNVEVEHHHEELEDILEDKVPVPAWVVAKMETATQNLSDITHYLDGQKEITEDEDEEEDEDEIKNKVVVEPINVSAGTKAEMTKKFTDDALGNLKGFLQGMEGVELRDDYTFDYKNEQYEIEPIIKSDEKGVSNAVFTIFDGDGEEVGEVAYSREGGKQKFTANSDFFNWNNTKFEDGGYFDGTIPSVSTYMSTYADGGSVKRTRRTKEQIRKDEYNKEVDLYNWYVVNISENKAESGFEYKEDALDLLSDYDGDKNFKVVSKKGLKSLGIEVPNESWKYAGGGEIAKAEILGLSTNIMGTTDIEMKITGMRKPQDFIVYPIGKDDAGNVITIQSNTRIGQINLVKGVGVMSQSHSNGAYFVHLQMDKKTPFTLSKQDLFALRAKIFTTSGENVGKANILSDNSGASRLFAKGGSLKKYIDHDDIKSVTLKLKGKEVTIKGSDVLNGVNLLEKGGDITSKANYVPKRDVVEVELKDGSTVKPANGYWVKKGAEPIGAEPTPTSSGKSEPKIGTTEIRKDMRGNWRAETNIDDFNGYDWRISTVKTYSGNLVSSAQGGKTMPSGSKGINMFSYTVYQDPNHTLEVSKPKRLTDKVVSEQHDKALAKFKKFMETGMFKGGGKISNFDKLSAKVAKNYEGKPVQGKYQEEYGKYYSKEEAQEVGDKVAGKVKAMQNDKKAFGGIFSKTIEKINKKSEPKIDLSQKQVKLKTGELVQVFSHNGNDLEVLKVQDIGSGTRPYVVNISEIDPDSYEMGGQTEAKKSNGGSQMMKKANDLAKQIRKKGESWNDAKKRAFAELKK